MGENIMFVCEKREANMGDALIARNMAMTNFIGLGPPDLVVLEKNYTPPKLLLGVKSSKHSYFHWTLGNDVSSSAAVATYLGFLLENQEKQPLGRGSFSIDKCYNCSYNAFRKMDLRVEITVPEPARKHSGYTIEAYAVDAVGNRHDLDELFWKETYVCAMLRLIEGPPQALRPIKIKDALNDPLAETFFLNSCTELFTQGRKLGNPENAYSLYGVDSSNNMLTSTICKYFIHRNRFEHMLAFFDTFADADPVVSVPIAYAETMLDKSPQAMTLLDSSLRRKPDSSSIMLSMAELSLLKLPTGLDRYIKLLDTLKTILRGISLQPNLARGWWILAKCLIEMGRYEWSLVVMNNAPVVNEDFAQAAVDSYGNPHFEKFTNPEHFVNHILTILQDEENSFRGEHGDASLQLLAAPTISADEKTVYGLLSDIISRSSWDHLTKIRSRVLVRPSEMVKAKNRFLRGELQTSTSGSNESITTTSQQQAATDAPVTVVTQPFVPPSSVNASSMAASSTSDGDHKDEGREEMYKSTDSEEDRSIQQSSEFSPIQRETRESTGTEEKKEMVVQQGTDLRQTQEILASSIDSADLQDVSIGSEKQFSAPSFSVARDLDVDDALTKFLVYVISGKNGVPVADVPTTPMNIEVASSPMIPVKEISRNVDVAFHAIFQDIKAFHAWKEDEKKLNLVGVEDLPAKDLIPNRSVADWIRIANMCERLSFTKDAAKIYKMLEHNHIKALASIVLLDADRGDIKSTLLDASTLLSRYSPASSTASASSSLSSKFNLQQPHPTVVSAIVKLIASQGAHKVRTMQSSMPNLHPLLPPVVSDTVRWKSKGFAM